MSIVLKSWSLNLLEPSAPVQDYNGNRKHYFAFVLVILLDPLNKARPVVNITMTVFEDLTLCTVVHKRKHFGGSFASIFMAVPLLNLHNNLPNQTIHTPKDYHLSANNLIFTSFMNYRPREVVWAPNDYSPKLCVLYGILHTGIAGIVQNLMLL